MSSAGCLGKPGPQYTPRISHRTSVDTLVISGSETDVCVLSTVLGAVDRGYRVVIAIDALCSSSNGRCIDQAVLKSVRPGG